MADSHQWSSHALHETVRRELRLRIESGQYQPGDAIPSTAALSEDFGVSPITVKRAVRDLQAVGLLTAIAGKGTFVKQQKRLILPLDSTSSVFGKASVRLLSVTREKLADPSMQLLEPPDEPMLCVRKLIFFDEPEPALYDQTYLSSEVSDDMIDEFSRSLVSTTLRERSIETLETAHLIDAIPASGQAGEVFGVPNGYPMLRRQYRLRTSDPGTTIYGALQAPFDKMTCSLNIEEIG